MVRGLRFSLRRYVLAVLLVMGAVVITVFSLLSTNNFFEGMDGMLRGTMISAARNTPVEAGKPAKVLSFTIAAQWQDLPEEVQQQFGHESLRPFRLYKFIERRNLLTRPHAAKFLVKVITPENTPRYVSQVFRAPNVADEPRWVMSRQLWSVIFGAVALLIFTAALLVLMRTVSQPVEGLREWAANLDEKELDKPIPVFRYQELNSLAELIHSSLQHVKQSLQREREFVSHASHELRTPIAVIRSSIELLQRLALVENTKGSNAIKRIDHASHTMTDLTETLLWLGKAERDPLSYQQVSIDTMVNQLTEDLSYLLDGKAVTVSLGLKAYSAWLPATACRIVIGNLIRNAFQHTMQGQVGITQIGDTLTIENCESSDSDLSDNNNPPDNSAMDHAQSGYGLGLELVRRITATLNWPYHHEMTAHGHKVVLTLRAAESGS